MPISHRTIKPKKPPAPPPPNHDHDDVWGFVKEMLDTNERFVNEGNVKASKALSRQTPRATVLMCSDSRVQDEAFDTEAFNDLFVIRNIGNQIHTADGSTEYGIRHLHTPIFLIIGHSDCGAVDAAMHDFSNESEHIIEELTTLNVDINCSIIKNVLANVHHQVEVAASRFNDLIANDKLIIIGAVYDLHNALNHDHGRMVFININNERDPESIQNIFHSKGLKNCTIVGLPSAK